MARGGRARFQTYTFPPPPGAQGSHCSPNGVCSCKPVAQKYVLASLDTSDPRTHPKKCALCLSGAFHIAAIPQHPYGEWQNPIVQPRADKARAKAEARRKKNVESDRDVDTRFWNAVIAFFVVDRTEEDIRDLLQALEDTCDVCVCRPASNSAVAVESIRGLAERRAMGDYREKGIEKLDYHCLDIRGMKVPGMDDDCAIQPEDEGRRAQENRYPKLLGIKQRHSSRVNHESVEEGESELGIDSSRQSPSLEGGTGEKFIMHLMEVLCKVIDPNAYRATAKGRSRSWPYAPTDLLPFGADSFVRSMQLWARFIPDLRLVGFMRVVLTICGSLVAPSLVERAFTRITVLEMGKAMVKRVMELLGGTEDHATGSAGSFLKRRKNIAYVLFEQLEHLTEYFKGAMVEQPVKWQRKLFEGCEWRTIQLSSMLAYLCEDSRFPKSIKDDPDWGLKQREVLFVGQVTAWHFAYGEGMRSPKGMLVHPSIVECDTRTTLAPKHKPGPRPAQAPSSIQTEVAGLLPRLRVSDYCSTFGCNQSVHSAGRAFQSCAKCGVALYCGRECQTKSWKGKDLDSVDLDSEKVKGIHHKALCGIFVKLLSVDGAMEFFKEGAANRSPAQVQAMVDCWDASADVIDDEFLRARRWLLLIIFGKVTLEEPSDASAKINSSTKVSGSGWDDYTAIIEQLVSFGKGTPALPLDIGR